jgi:hypothetical protein
MTRLAARIAHEILSTSGLETDHFGGGPHHECGPEFRPATRDALRLTLLKPIVLRPANVTARVHAAANASARSRRSSCNSLTARLIGDFNQTAVIELSEQRQQVALASRPIHIIFIDDRADDIPHR